MRGRILTVAWPDAMKASPETLRWAALEGRAAWSGLCSFSWTQASPTQAGNNVRTQPPATVALTIFTH